MKTFAAGLAASIASGSTTLCACLRVLRTDGALELFTSCDRDVVFGGETYRAETGLDISSLVSQVSLAVDNMELQVLPDEDSYPQVDILAGRWDGARFWMFECDYADPSIASGIFSATRTDINFLKRGTAGDTSTLRSSNVFEFRGLKQALQGTIAVAMSKTCRARFGDASCTLNAADWTVRRVVTAVASRRQFTAVPADSPSGLHDDSAADWYKEGEIISLDGLNDGYRAKVKAFAADVFTLVLPLPFEIQIGDTFDCIAGDQKRFEEDCRDKFGNQLNFQGEPHGVGVDALTADPVVDAPS